MSVLRPEVSGCAAVFLGNFTPAIFQPAWFLRQDLFSEAEAEAAVIGVIHPEITQFTTERFAIHVTTEQLGITSKPDAIGEHVRDLALGIFYLLEHTPLSALGINFMMHFQLSSEDTWHQLGDRLSPKSAWKELLPERPGMESLVVSSTLPGEPDGSKKNVKVEPSRQIKNGVYFEINNHFNPKAKEEARQEFVEILKTKWSDLQDDATKIADGIIRWSAETH